MIYTVLIIIRTNIIIIIIVIKYHASYPDGKLLIRHEYVYVCVCVYLITVLQGLNK